MFATKSDVERYIKSLGIIRDRSYEEDMVDIIMKTQGAKELYTTMSFVEASECNDQIVFELMAASSEKEIALANKVGKLDTLYFPVKCPHCHDVAYTEYKENILIGITGHVAICRKCGKGFSAINNMGSSTRAARYSTIGTILKKPWFWIIFIVIIWIIRFLTF